ncbi:hypothetical protein DWF00_28400 [Bosea caraganae]|uniref:Uncharacterized protein n=1 Tax=Bosea caraganae TaxID=2763117 RepID=A0A370L350_9HYPH|nr:hypothetical protein [Bosea caraganae]RDJ20866.1 hypothetical protein DWF00_28400 [Bosea caraganae]RDJ22601.1 hypothetical protein DWE98_19425 [Bosea caraganae]
MSNQDVVIAMALNAGLRRLLVAAFVHQREKAPGDPQMRELREAFKREIARLMVRGAAENGEDIELTTAVRKSLQLFVDAAYREAAEERVAAAPLQ